MKKVMCVPLAEFRVFDEIDFSRPVTPTLSNGSALPPIYLPPILERLQGTHNLKLQWDYAGDPNPLSQFIIQGGSSLDLFVYTTIFIHHDTFKVHSLMLYQLFDMPFNIDLEGITYDQFVALFKTTSFDETVDFIKAHIP
jgi:hypothetical protein